ncbi:glutamyl-tRNA reductase [Salinibacillus xinjiangensis]|uniref:Glutamyl-tRNA reductase n=1 Tax=Salinibacillus xinjiangensis TaxID=1229268 RepID=A0A6G1XBB8_9BACI|nr:glutamyl-tRNA reductase [Salinibacillus xinjiangensis]MRG88205.1 glutamyl-tRNA reductase [Salinibacillus xinjiangensis]
MHTLVISINYKTAPVEIREQLAFSDHELVKAMTKLSDEKSILENVIVSTCNRTEIYAVVDQIHTGRYYIKRFLSEWFSLSIDDIASYIAIHEEDEAVQHLFRLTCGLESMVLGETQILGQVKHAFLAAQEHKTSGTIFNQLFKQAITVAKRSHKETEIGENAVSVSYAAVELAKKIFGDLDQKKVAILGAGKMGELALKNLYGSGVASVAVVNRTIAKAEELAQKMGGKAYSLDDLNEVIQSVDILISSTGANSYVLNKNTMKSLIRKRKGRPLFLMDIAVPRDIDPALNELEDVFLYDIDDLQGIVDANLEARKEMALETESLILAEINEYKEWLQTLGVVPVISALRQKALTIQAETMKSIERKMPDLTPREQKVLNKHTKSIINQLLKQPILQAKELAGEKNADESLELFTKIFGIEEEVENELEEQKAKLKQSGKTEVEGKGKTFFKPTFGKSSIHS